MAFFKKDFILRELTELKDLIAKLNEEPSLVKLRSSNYFKFEFN